MEIGDHIVPRRSIHAEKTNQGFSFIDYHQESPSERMEDISPQILEDQQPIDVDEEETTSWRQTNPLLIANVLETIFSHVDHATLKTCCTVSSLWCVLATPLLRSRSQIHLGGPLYDERSEAFLSTMSSSATLPMASLTYKLHRTCAAHSSFLSSRAANFFSQFGPSLTSLTLQAYHVSNPKQYFSVVSHLVGRDCPSLTRLALTHLQFLHFDDPLDPATLNFTSPSIRHFTIDWGATFTLRPGRVLNGVAVFKSLLAIAPNATNLAIECPDGGETFTLFLRTLRDSQISGHLTTFSLAGAPLDKVAMNVLNSMNFPKLTSFTIDSKITVQTEFIQFLEKLSPTLEKLVMFGDNWGINGEGRITMDFPLMPKLRVFKYENFSGLRVASADFLKRLPNLGELVIRNCVTSSVGDMRRTVYGTMFSPREEIMGENPIYVNVHVKKVVLDVVFVPSFENLGSIDKILKMFPNMAEFELTVSFACKNICVGYVLETLAESKIRKLKIKFLKCAELSHERVSASFRAALERYLPKFSELQRVEFTLNDLPSMSRFHLPLYVVEGMLCTKSLRVLNLTGFFIGEDFEEETEMCRQLLDYKLVEWNISDSVIPGSLYCSILTTY
ncbi:hypothetical protein Fcan01_10248 [Folsomia candida]|uniref:F-box domain-containing protein n=1 Tax=Folsomia candida TaxID=158441 RepID=A0A226E8S1_FOLCA|nr:hypothetical protein Fcan01_10248 [Folsomia candida]